MSLQTHRFVLPYYLLGVSLVGLGLSLIARVPAAIALNGVAVAVAGTLSLLVHRALRRQREQPLSNEDEPRSADESSTEPGSARVPRRRRLTLGWLAGFAAGFTAMRVVGQPLWLSLAIPAMSVTVLVAMLWWVDRRSPP